MSKRKVIPGRLIISTISYKYLPCINTQYNDSKYWFGRICDSDNVMVDQDCVSVVCGVCVGYITAPGDPALKKLERSSYPKGWALLKQFVDENGNVFFKGKEQPDLQGTLPPTDISELEKLQQERKKDSKKIVKEKKVNNNNNINTKTIQLSKLKKLLKTVKSPKEQQKIVNEIKKLEKEIIREK